MRTVTIQIGNSDDKLPQEEWSQYAEIVHEIIQVSAKVVYFSGASLPFAPWQNAAWVFEVDEADVWFIKKKLGQVRGSFNQDSIAWTEGETEMI